MHTARSAGSPGIEPGGREFAQPRATLRSWVGASKEELPTSRQTDRTLLSREPKAVFQPILSGKFGSDVGVLATEGAGNAGPTPLWAGFIRTISFFGSMRPRALAGLYAM